MYLGGLDAGQSLIAIGNRLNDGDGDFAKPLREVIAF